MSIIPYYFKTDAESYITVPAMRHFLKEKSVDTGNIVIRSDMIEAIEEYAQSSDECAEQVRSWIDSLCRQGIIELRISSIETDMADALLINEGVAVRRMKESAAQLSPHIASQALSKKFKIVQCNEEITDAGRVISIMLCKTVYVVPSKQAPYTLAFPAFVDIYTDKSMVILRGKSKSTIFEYCDAEFTIEAAQPITLDNLFAEALTVIRNISGLNLKIIRDQNQLKRRLYCLLDKYTRTPSEIDELMNSNGGQIMSITELIKNEICNLDSAFDSDVLWDVKNLIEKYFSISYPDKTIFTKNRDAYPLKLIAKDDEDSKVEQTSALSEPLQSKAVFFDNKKMMQKSQCCEGMCFMYQRIDPLYFGKEFKVSFAAKDKYFIIKFFDFTMEEDIQHVLFSLFGSEPANGN